MIINGENHVLTEPATLVDVLRGAGYDLSRPLAVEQNGHIVPRTRFEDTLVRPDDRLEVVHFVGGG